MTILISDSWLREHLKTKATPKQIAKYLSLCSQSVEKVIKKDNDWVYEIEVTTNRPDCLSVYGIARELGVILPRFGIKSQLKEIPEKKIKIPEVKKGLPLEVKIKKSFLCPRFTAIIFDKISIMPSPKVIQDRLEKCGVRALNNVVDISNYLMHELGQPMHTFDYDKIKGAKMTLRESAGGETITTLDGQVRPLPDGAIIIEDGKGRIIDLCGIMGGKNSEVDDNTKRVLLFVQTYNPAKIRKTCQALAFRTEAASRFEKGVDSEGVILAMKKAIVMFEENCGAKVASKLIDIYPNPQKEKRITLSQEKLDQLLGIKIGLTEARRVLKSLGFSSQLKAREPQIIATVPHWRYDDISISEDLIEEIARIYGYHKLPSVLPQGEPTQEIQDPKFFWEQTIKDVLKYWGFTEVASYSMISKELLEKTGFNHKECLKISNPLTHDLVYMRPSLIPSLLNIIVQNQAETVTEQIQIFELANVYLPKGKDKLPDEKPMLASAITGEKFYQGKGIMEALLKELGLTSVNLETVITSNRFTSLLWHPGRTASFTFKKKGEDLRLGTVGEIHPSVLEEFKIDGRVTIFELDFEEILKYATRAKSYTPIPKYPPIIEDLAFLVPEKTLVGKMIEEIKKESKVVANVSLLDSYKDTRTFRITYQSPKKTLTDQEVEKIREKIIKRLKTKFQAELKSI